jgi:hypothetical protein
MSDVDGNFSRIQIIGHRVDLRDLVDWAVPGSSNLFIQLEPDDTLKCDGCWQLKP